jgi:hypothetical protein
MNAALRDYPVLLMLVVVPVLYVMVEVGFRVGQRVRHVDHKVHEHLASTRDQAGVLLSLLLAFMLAMAMTRFDRRKQEIVDEANAIGTLRLRAGLLSEPSRSAARRLIDEYVDARVDFAHAGVDHAALSRARARSDEIQKELWTLGESAAAQTPTPITALYVESLNQTIDASETRLAGLENRVPRSVWIIIVSLSMITAFVSGICTHRRSLTAMVLLPLMFSIVALLVADLDAPGRGSIRLNAASIERLAAP